MTKLIQLVFLVIVFLLFTALSQACLTPGGGDENIYLTQDSGENLTLCTDSYSFDDWGSPDGVFILNGANYIFDCNDSYLYGNKSGSTRGTAFLVNGENITLENCNVEKFDTGIYANAVTSLEVDTFMFQKNTYDIQLLFSDLITLQNIYSTNPSFYTMIDQSTRVVVENYFIYSPYSQAFKLLNSNDNEFRNILINDSASHAFQVSGDNNLFENISIQNGQYYGFKLDEGSNNIFRNSIINNTDDYGFYFSNFGDGGVNNSIYSSYIINNDNCGIYFQPSTAFALNYFYDNYFSNNGANCSIDVTNNMNNFFNTTKTHMTNIIGGNYSGGNYYDDYAGNDTDGDGIGETPYLIATGVYDYLPLTNNYTGTGGNETGNETQHPTNGTIHITVLGTNYLEGDVVDFEINLTDFTLPLNGTIDFGDGNVSSYVVVNESNLINHTYTDNANFTVTVIANDTYQEQINTSFVYVENVVPVVTDYIYMANQDWIYYFQPRFTDAGENDTHEAFVYWGDGTNSTHAVTGSNAINHNYTQDGNYTINFTIRDDDGGVSNWTHFTDEVIQEHFYILDNQTINITDNASIQTFIKYINHDNLTIDWGDGVVEIDVNESNGFVYTHNYSSFGTFIVQANLTGCRTGGFCFMQEERMSEIEVTVIGCGDEIIQSWEACEGNNFEGMTCADYGHNQGSLSCTSTCQIDASACYTRSSGGGGGSSSKPVTIVEINETEDEIEKNITLNKTEPIALENVTINSSLENFSRNVSVVNPLLNYSEVLRNTSLANLSFQHNQTLNLTMNMTLNQTNLLQEDLQELFSRLIMKQQEGLRLKNPLQELFLNLEEHSVREGVLSIYLQDFFDRLFV